MSREWFTKFGEKEIGPFSVQELRIMVANGRLTPNALVRTGIDGTWYQAGTIRGLFPNLPEQPAKQTEPAKPAPQAPPSTTSSSIPPRLPTTPTPEFSSKNTPPVLPKTAPKSDSPAAQRAPSPSASPSPKAVSFEVDQTNKPGRFGKGSKQKFNEFSSVKRQQTILFNIAIVLLIVGLLFGILTLFLTSKDKSTQPSTPAPQRSTKSPQQTPEALRAAEKVENLQNLSPKDFEKQ